MKPWVQAAERASELHGRLPILQAGMTPDALSRGVASGRVTRPLPNVVAFAGSPMTPAARLVQIVQSIGGGVAITGWAALFTLGFVRSVPSRIAVVVPRTQNPNRREGVTVHRPTWITERDVERRGDIPITRLAATLVIIAPQVSKPYLRSLIIHGRQQRLMTLDELRDVLRRARNAGGTRVLRELCAELDERDADSMLEIEFRDRWAWTPWPQPHPRPMQVDTPRHTVNVDVPWPQYYVGVDCHGFGKYDRAWDLDADTRRDNHLKVTEWRVLEATWNRVTGDDWHDLVEEIVDVLELQARRLGLPAIRRH
jgi:hypothetical protein